MALSKDQLELVKNVIKEGKGKRSIKFEYNTRFKRIIVNCIPISIFKRGGINYLFAYTSTGYKLYVQKCIFHLKHSLIIIHYVKSRREDVYKEMLLIKRNKI